MISLLDDVLSNLDIGVNFLTGYMLPRRLFYARNFAAAGHFAETYSADAKSPHESPFAAATKTPPHSAGREFLSFFTSGYY